MNKLTKAQFTQLSFPGWSDESTNQNQDKPHPLIVAERWGFELTVANPKDDPKDYLYHAVQWTQGLGAKTSATWNDIKRQLYDSTIQLKIRILPYKSRDGKTYQVDYISQETCYAVAQVMRVTKSRPQLAEIQSYLAKAGVFTDNLRRGDRQTIEWFNARMHGVEARKRNSKIILFTNREGKPQFGVLTNVTYYRLFDTRDPRTATKDLLKALGLKAWQNVRDYMHITGIISIDSAESLASEKMLLEGRKLTNGEQIRITDEVAQMEAEYLKRKCDYLKIDLITGKPLALISEGWIDAFDEEAFE
jgi:hypothetical protein